MRSLPYVCPVCQGRGQVMEGFYRAIQSDSFSTSGKAEQCKSCIGTGVVWGFDDTPGDSLKQLEVIGNIVEVIGNIEDVK